ncbi:hypothetical protein EV421DRAFT_1999124 [Armillaria borealis]|uniref:Uncharacterized protein n=1 Tax=Armillaria borealis TaxID=47425 RepID=A0AA39JTC1_9AGAR|nr:hypothetical protein EV421DRAFT_1999124 [Armillaria borealis]
MSMNSGRDLNHAYEREMNTPKFQRRANRIHHLLAQRRKPPLVTKSTGLLCHTYIAQILPLLLKSISTEKERPGSALSISLTHRSEEAARSTARGRCTRNSRPHSRPKTPPSSCSWRTRKDPKFRHELEDGERGANIPHNMFWVVSVCGRDLGVHWRGVEGWSAEKSQPTAQISLGREDMMRVCHGEGPLRNVCVGGSEERCVTRNESYDAVPPRNSKSMIIMLQFTALSSDWMHISPVETTSYSPRWEVETDEEASGPGGAFDLDPSFSRPADYIHLAIATKGDVAFVTIKGLIRGYVMRQALAEITDKCPGDLVHGFQGKGDVGSSCSGELTLKTSSRMRSYREPHTIRQYRRTQSWLKSWNHKDRCGFSDWKRGLCDVQATWVLGRV